MIDYIKGVIVEREADAVIIEAQDIGYRVYCPDPFAFEDRTMIYIYDHIREDGRTLYGFAGREEQRLFRRLLDVNGIGPKSALAILSAVSVKSLVLAIAKEDITALSKLPGIGRKTAQRMILDIKDGLAERIHGGSLPSGWLDFGEGSAQGMSSGKPADAGKANASGLPAAWLEAKTALIGLGYTEAELQPVWQTLKERQQADEMVTTEQYIKLALQQFAMRR